MTTTTTNTVTFASFAVAANAAPARLAFHPEAMLEVERDRRLVLFAGGLALKLQLVRGRAFALITSEVEIRLGNRPDRCAVGINGALGGQLE